ncbi:hypothetical protein LshimejAT787_1300190 [Lyophyllum shimeji]|uniref:Uncharacterized protein n=1 Tax=Lyophyllum shimeji TaxID=47721 RepID=A0A9P3URY2_LYOSH|nr:hypothetical protein LshimejAT787_1300190 [Lyophyllum shimeji]
MRFSGLAVPRTPVPLPIKNPLPTVVEEQLLYGLVLTVVVHPIHLTLCVSSSASLSVFAVVKNAVVFVVTTAFVSVFAAFAVCGSSPSSSFVVFAAFVVAVPFVVPFRLRRLRPPSSLPSGPVHGPVPGPVSAVGLRRLFVCYTQTILSTSSAGDVDEVLFPVNDLGDVDEDEDIVLTLRDAEDLAFPANDLGDQADVANPGTLPIDTSGNGTTAVCSNGAPFTLAQALDIVMGIEEPGYVSDLEDPSSEEEDDQSGKEHADESVSEEEGDYDTDSSRSH